LYLAAGVVSLPLTLYPPTWVIGILLLNFAFLQLALLFSTVIHELGHVVAGSMVGFRVFGIEIGYGPVVYEFIFLKFRWRIRAICFGGITQAIPNELPLFRCKEFILILGGPLANICLLLLSIYLLPLDELFKQTPVQGVCALPLIALSNALLILYSLVPHMAKTVAGKIPNDGLLLWKIWRYQQPEMEQTIAARYIYEAHECRRRKEMANAVKWIEDGLRCFPECFSLKFSAAEFLFHEKKYLAAARAFAVLLAKKKANNEIASYLLNYIAYSYLMAGRPELLCKADVCSRLALEKMPWSVYNKGTRGSVLVELSQYEEGLKLLREAVRDQPEREGRALDACHIAIAEVRRGNHDESRKYANLARRLDPDCVLLERISAWPSTAVQPKSAGSCTPK